MMKQILLLSSLTICLAINAQNVGIGETSPANKFSVKGNLSVGSGYSTTAAPVNGAIIQGNVGIGTSSPANPLEVAGKIKTTTFQMTNGASLGSVLVSDFTGNGVWTSAATIFAAFGSGTQNFLTKFNNLSGTTIGNSQVYDNGTNVGVGTVSPSQKLEVLGTTKTTNLQMTTGAANGSYLQSDASGNGTWTALTTANTPNIYSADGSLAASRIVTMAANNLTLGSTTGNLIFNPSSTGKMGIGTASPNASLDVNGNIQISNATIPMGLMTEVGGTTPLLDFDVNFRETNKTNTYRGAALRIDTRTGSPLFQWISRAAGSATENVQMVFTEAGQLGIGNSSPAYTLDVTGNFHSTAEAYAATYLRADGQSFLFANGSTDATNNVVMRKDANNGYLWPWGTGTALNTVVVGGGTNTNLKVTGTTDLASWATASVAANGYAKMGGLLIQWGSGAYSSNSAATVTFPTAFTTVYSVTATVDAGANTGSGANAPVKVMTIGTTSFQYAGQAAFSGDAVSKIRWIAIGN